MSKDDPETQWRCCSLWQRLLSNKWNAREFVQRHGFRVPALYWHGRRLADLPIDRLPDNFVIRPVWGTAQKGAYVFCQGRNLLDGKPFTKASLKAHLVQTAGRVARFPTMVEEVVKTEAGEYALPNEYKFFMFGATVGAIQVVQRAIGSGTKHCFYRPDWVAFDDPVNTHNLAAAPIGPPRCLDEMVTCAQRLGGLYETFVRVDLYATDSGCVFGEFSSTPLDGEDFTPFAEHYFDELWERHCPGRT